MPERTDQRDAIAAALAAFAARPLAEAARGLFAALGYASDRRVPLATPKAFLGQFDAAGRITLDKGGAYYFVGSGGGGGGGYGITIRQDAHLSLRALLGILNSSPADFYLKKVSTPFSNGYFAYNRQFIEQIPVPKVDDSCQNKIERLAAILLWTNISARGQAADQSTRDPLMLAYFEQILNGMVYELYFPEEVHGAGLHLFDAVAKEKLPAIETIPEEDRLPRLRTLFETLYDGTHPLRIALDKLQTLDTVRIIEGKV